jgi:hypothetical protein
METVQTKMLMTVLGLLMLYGKWNLTSPRSTPTKQTLDDYVRNLKICYIIRTVVDTFKSWQ